MKVLKVTVAIDSFKGCMSSLEAGNAVRAGILGAVPVACVEVYPAADGGEGTVEALKCKYSNWVERRLWVAGPLGDKVESTYLIIDGNSHKTAVLEMASAAGLTLLPEDKRNPLNTTTYGVGEMIRDAINQGCRHFIVGIGGSATNDGGIGMLQALGYGFVDENGYDVPYGANGLSRLSDIYFENAMFELSECTFRIACDVENPLVGDLGCSTVFAPQKGGTKDMIQNMERCMNHYADMVEHIAECDMSEIHEKWLDKCDKASKNSDNQINISRHCPGTGAEELWQMREPIRIDRHYPGTGAAGGLGYAFLMFLNAELERGVDIILDELDIEKDIIDSDYVITGEGKLDFQTINGKTPAGVARLAKKYGKKVIAFAGCIDDGAKACKNANLIDEYFSISDEEPDLETAMRKETAIKNLESKAEQIFRKLQKNDSMR